VGHQELQQKGIPFTRQLHSFAGHGEAVNAVAWNPRHSMQFASGSSDRKVVFWDVERLNMNTQ
jgi:WD40 repeat protein